jgi:tRNA pseudouridine32 synthase/23S rRNA pseudouridine746 synthase
MENTLRQRIIHFLKGIFGDWELRAQLHPLPKKARKIPSPTKFTYPFCYRPHKICRIVVNEVVEYCYKTRDMVPTEGKMFGILIVEYKGKRYYLRAFSGIYNGSYHHKGFVPPVVDLQDPKGHFRQQELEIVDMTNRINAIKSNLPKFMPPDRIMPDSMKHDVEELEQLKAKRKEMSQNLQMWTFHQFRMRNAEGEEADLIDIFKDYKSPFPEEEYIAYKEGRITVKPHGKYGVPPGGAGECCLPKLLQYAYLHNLKPICMEEFWVGPSTGNQMRVEKNFYPSCQHKCVPILTFMMKGLHVEENPLFARALQKLQGVRTIYEDDDLMVVFKPSGLLSVPSKNKGEPSLQVHLAMQNPNYMLMHRLDQDTSGVMLVAKNHQTFGWFQQQFAQHKIKKKYVALLEEEVPAIVNALRAVDENTLHSGVTEFPTPTPEGRRRGTIKLPLSRNPFDSPRQIVDHRFGKSAFTYYEFTSPNRVELYPHSGRTHQLRIHCAHPEGLNRPIKGDVLYGTAADRLYLHAESITFQHPTTMQWMTFTEKAF